MQRHRLIGFALVALVAAGTVMLAARGRGGQTLYTGTPADIIKVRVVNSGRGEALPVSIQEGASVLKVEVANKVTLDPATVVNARIQPPTWEYKWLGVPTVPDDASARLLSTEGAQGWEATGVVVTSPAGPRLLFKRQK